MLKRAFYFTLIILSLTGIVFAQQPSHKKAAKKPVAKTSTTPKSADSTISAGTSDSTKVVKTKKPAEAKKKGPEKDTLHVSIGEVVSILHNGTGWVKDDFGKWISSPKRIPFEDPDLNNEYYSRYEIGKDNFQEMDLMPVSFQGKKYFSLAVRYMKAINEEQKDKTKEWNRGAYLVRAVAHCGECHTPRDLLGGLKTDRRFAGGNMTVDGVKAPDITPDPGAIGRWSIDDLASYLDDGLTPSGDIAGGAMAEVIRGTSALSVQDRRAIAFYIKSQAPIAPAPSQKASEGG